MDEESPMIEHLKEYHEGAPPNFKVEMMKNFARPLQRQIYEGIMINANKAITMNRKREWGQNLPPKFEIEGHKKMTIAPKARKKPEKRLPDGESPMEESEGIPTKR